MAFDPRWLDPNYYAGLPLGGLTQYDVGRSSGYSALPSQIDQSQLQNLIALSQGKSQGLLGGVFNPFTPDYITNRPASAVGMTGADARPLNELSRYFAFSADDPTFSQLSPTARSYLTGAAGNSFDVPTALANGATEADLIAMFSGERPTLPESYFTAENILKQFTPGDYSVIESSLQPYRTAQQLYATELLRKAQSGQIKVIEDKSGGIFGSIMGALPGIVGAAVGGPIGGALGGAISGGLTGGGLKGAALGAVGGGIAGAGGLGSVLGKIPTGGSMNSITSALSNIAGSNLNPFSLLGRGLESLGGGNQLLQPLFNNLSDAISLGGPGALLGGALGGKQGALIGGLGGGLLGLGLDTQNGLFGANGLFGGNTVGGNPVGGLFGGGGTAGGTAGSGLLNSLFGGAGGLGGLLAGGIPLALLTNEANKVTNTPVNMRTPFSSIADGTANLDPMIRNTTLDSINNTWRMLGDARGNQNAFIQARVNPLEAQVARQRGQLEQSLGLRGVAGSSFGDQALTNFGLESERALGDARSQATQEALGFESGLNQLLAQGGSQLLAQELAALGLSGQNIEALLNRAKLRTDLFGRAASQFGSLLGG